VLSGGEVVEVSGRPFGSCAQDHVDAIGQVGHVSDEAGVDGDEKCIDHAFDGSPGRRRRYDRGRAEQNDDTGRSGVDGPLERDVVDDAPVDVLLAIDLYGREDGGHGGRGEDGLDGGAMGKPALAPVRQ